MPISNTSPLLIVTLLFRSRPELDQLTHVVGATSAYLDSSVKLGISKACKFNSVELLERIWQSRSPQQMGTNQLEFQRAMTAAIQIQGIKLLAWFFDHFRGCCIPSEIVQHAAAEGKLEVLQFFKENGTSLAGDLDFVDGSMQPEVVNLLFQQELAQTPDNEHNSDTDDRLGFLYHENPERLRSIETTQSLHLKTDVASKSRFLDIGVEWDGDDIVYAAQNQQIDTVKWLYSHSPAYHNINKAMKAAARNQDVKLLEWFRARYQYGI